jgi:excisionase family DNA binding protein
MNTTNHPNPQLHNTGPSLPQASAPSTLLTVAEACAELRISRWTLYRLIQTRRLATIKIGSRRLVPLIDLQTLIESLRSGEAS